MAQKVNTSESMGKIKDADLKKQVEKMGEKYKKMKKEKISIPVAFQKHVGKTWFIGINGVSMNIPVDGKQYEVPEVFAKHLRRAMNELTT